MSNSPSPILTLLQGLSNILFDFDDLPPALDFHNYDDYDVLNDDNIEDKFHDAVIPKK